MKVKNSRKLRPTLPPPLLYSTILNLVAAFCLIVYYNSGNETKKVCQDKLLKAFLLMVPLSSRHLLISINYWFHYVFIYQTEDALDLSPKSCSPSSPVFRLFSGSSQSLLLQISLLVPLLLFGDSCLGLLIYLHAVSKYRFICSSVLFFPHLHPLQQHTPALLLLNRKWIWRKAPISSWLIILSSSSFLNGP